MRNPAVRELPQGLRDQITDCGYYPELVASGLALAVGTESVLHHVVHHEATFNAEEVQRHLTVLVITPTRLVVSHTDESTDGNHDSPQGEVRAISSTESIPLSAISSVGLTQVVREPHRFGQVAHPLVETWLTIGWGTMRRIQLEPASCADPGCDADHGYAGSLVADDLVVRMSPLADGEHLVHHLVDFGTALQQAAGRQP